MCKYIFIFLLLNIFAISAGFSQNILVLEKTGTAHNFKYTEGQHIQLQLKKGDFEVAGQIGKISDTSIIFTNGLELMLSDIKTVYRSRYGFRLLNRIFLTAGIAYISISLLNGMINGDAPIVPSETLIISGSLIAAGLLLKPVIVRKFKMESHKWKLVILDFTDDVPTLKK